MRELSKEGLFESVERIFDSMLGLPIASAREHSAPDGEIRVTSAVSLTGDWNGSILIECPGESACGLAGALLMTECPQVDDDVKDVMCEITNMVAGNVSRRLPGSTQLSLPSVVSGSKYTLDVLKGQKLIRLPLRCEALNFSVSVIKASAG